MARGLGHDPLILPDVGSVNRRGDKRPSRLKATEAQPGGRHGNYGLKSRARFSPTCTHTFLAS